MWMIVNGALIEYRYDSRSIVQRKKTSNINSNNNVNVASINIYDIRSRKIMRRY
jgi:hypothetical protein